MSKRDEAVVEDEVARTLRGIEETHRSLRAAERARRPSVSRRDRTLSGCEFLYLEVHHGDPGYFLPGDFLCPCRDPACAPHGVILMFAGDDLGVRDPERADRLASIGWTTLPGVGLVCPVGLSRRICGGVA